MPLDPPLFHALVTAEGRAPSRWMFALHGILGSGANLRSLARRVVSAVPSWGVALVDLRMHGQSQSASPPHTIAAAAEDLVRLEASLPGPVEAVLGHSFGGKVALTYAGRKALREIVLLDANPSARDPAKLGAHNTLRALASLPEAFSSRAEFIALLRERGVEAAEAEWLATNVRRDRDASSMFHFRLDLKAIHALLEDYCLRDLWPVVERDVPNGPTVHLLIGGASDAFSPSERARAEALAARLSSVRVTVIPGAHHWVHVDAPDAVFEITRAALAAREGEPA